MTEKKTLAFFPAYTPKRLAGIAAHGRDLTLQAAAVYPELDEVRIRLTYTIDLVGLEKLGGTTTVTVETDATDDAVSDILSAAFGALVENLEAHDSTPEQSDSAPRRSVAEQSGDDEVDCKPLAGVSGGLPLTARIVEVLAQAPKTKNALATTLRRSPAELDAALRALEKVLEPTTVVIRGRSFTAYALRSDTRVGPESGDASGVPSGADAHSTPGGLPPTSLDLGPCPSGVGAGRSRSPRAVSPPGDLT